MAKLDAWLDDERFFEPFRDKYHQRLGRPSVPADTYLRITVLKHQYRLSDRQVCARVTERISWRRFCRIPWNMSVPHGLKSDQDADGSHHMAALNAHLVRKAKRRNKVRVDTTVVEAKDTVRVVTRLVKHAKAVLSDAGTAISDHTRSIKKRVLQIAKVLKRRMRRITGEMAGICPKSSRTAAPEHQVTC